MKASGRQREARLHAVQQAASRVMVEAATAAEGIPRILETLCVHLRWDYGAVWNVDRQANVLRFVANWHLPSVAFTRFEELSRRTAFAPGIGLPGRVWASGEPAWIHDVPHDGNFPRAPVAALEGLHGAVGFPILLGGEILGVMEFFSRRIRRPDRAVLQLLGAIGLQIGQFLERGRAEENRAVVGPSALL